MLGTGSGRKHTRKFVAAWRVGRPWLEYKSSMMFCTYCTTEAAKIAYLKAKLPRNSEAGNFIDGTHNMRKSCVVDHEGSRAHEKATNLCRARKETESQTINESVAGKALIQLKQQERSRLRVLFKNAHVIEYDLHLN